MCNVYTSGSRSPTRDQSHRLTPDLLSDSRANCQTRPCRDHCHFFFLGGGGGGGGPNSDQGHRNHGGVGVSNMVSPPSIFGDHFA